MLYIIATPIGNLADITLRALETLKTCHYILCEDTRRSHILLSQYDIKTPLISFHKFSEKRKEASIVEDLKEGKKIALISDAGTPLIADPGESLISLLIKENIPFTVIPGPSSIISALVLSGLQTSPFQFLGFIPKKNKKTFLEELLTYSGTSLAFESPERLLNTLKDLKEIVGDRPIKVSIIRELTKTYEECLRAPLPFLINHFETTPPRGEFVLAIESTSLRSSTDTTPYALACIRFLAQHFKLSLKEAIKIYLDQQALNKRSLYKILAQEGKD